MIVVNAVLEVDPNRMEEARAEAQRAEDFCRGLPGWRGYRISEPVSGEGELHVVEMWEDLASFEAHISAFAAESSLDEFRQCLKRVTGSIYTPSETTDFDSASDAH